MGNKKTTTKLSYILLALIIAAGICRFSYGFFVQKQGAHSDETWSFGLANSYYEPYIQYSDDTSEYRNVDTWITNEVFRDYLTVQKGERFAFGSVYYNMSCDTHPPLYFMLLHFLCSFFPNQYMFVIGFIINMAAYIILSIFMYKLLLLITKSEAVSLIGVLFSTFSLGMLNMTMFVRMYLCVAAVATIYSYLNAKLYYNEEKRHKVSSYILIGVTALIGALTDNFFLPYAFATTLIFCICWCVKKDFKTLWKYILSAACGIILSIVIFPKTFTSMLGSLGISIGQGSSQAAWTVVNSSTRYMPVPFQFRLALAHVNKELFGYEIFSGYKSYIGIYISCAVFVLIIVAAFMSFLFRKDAWFIKLCGRIKNGILTFFRTFNFVTLSLVCSVLITCLAAAYIADLYGLGDTGDRYIFACLPAAMVVFVLAFWRICTLIFRNRQVVISIVLALVLAASTISSGRITCTYFMECPTTMKLEDISKDSNFIIISAAKWMLVQYADKLIDCNEAFLTADYDLDNQLEKIDGHKLDGDTYILIDMTRINSTQIDIEKNNVMIDYLKPTYISNELNPSSIPEEETDPRFDLKTVLKKCKDLSFVNDLTYIGCDGLNYHRINVYKVN